MKRYKEEGGTKEEKPGAGRGRRKHKMTTKSDSGEVHARFPVPFRKSHSPSFCYKFRGLEKIEFEKAKKGATQEEEEEKSEADKRRKEDVRKTDWKRWNT